MILILYVDDMLVAGATTREIEELADKIIKHFRMKRLGEPEKFLGFNIRRDRENQRMYISQEEYTLAMLKKYGFDDTRTAHTPWPPKFELPTSWKPLEEETKMYQKRSGALNWLSTGTRPDITYTVNKLAKGNAGPSAAHIYLQKHLFRYLKT